MSQSWRPSQGPRQSQHSGPQPPYGPPDPGYGRPGPNSGRRPQPDYGSGEYGGSGYGEQGDSGYGPPDPGYGPPGYGYRSVPSRPGSQGGWPPAQDDSGWGGAGAQPPGRYAEYPGYSQYPQAPYQQYQQAPYGQYSGHPYDDPYAYTRPPQRPRQSQNRGWVLLLIIMLLVFLGVGVGAAYALTRVRGTTPPTTAQSTTTTTSASKTPGAIPAGFKAYSEPAAHVKFAIPNGWTTQGTAAGATGLIVLSPDESSAFIVKQYSGTLDKVAAATGGLAGAAGASGTVSNKQGPTTVNLAGASWVQESADITRDGQTLHMVILVTNHGGASYAFGYFAYKSSFASANSRYFQPAQASFTFI